MSAFQCSKLKCDDCFQTLLLGWGSQPAPLHHGPEYAEFNAVPKCREGPHTVRFRYLVSKGNDRRLTLTSRGGRAPTPVEFPEPYRFDSGDTYTWATTPPVLVRMTTVGRCRSTPSGFCGFRLSRVFNGALVLYKLVSMTRSYAL